MNLFRKYLSRLAVASLFIISVIVLSCGTARKPDISEKATVSKHPTTLTADVNHESVLLKWKTNRDDLLIKGYNIYLDSRAARDDTMGLQIDKMTLVVGDVYPGDTDPSTDYETFAASDLKDGIPYFAAVTTVFADGTESEPSNTVKFICHPRGEFRLAQSYSGKNDGYSLGQAKYVPTDDLDNYIYYAIINGKDYLLSPSRINDVLRKVEFFKSSLKSVDDKIKRPHGQGAEKIAITAGDGCLLRTADGSYAKLIVKDFEGSGSDRVVRIEYSFMPVPNLLDF